MAIFSEEDRKTLKDIFSENLKNIVEIELFLDYNGNKETSEIAKEIADEIMKLTDKIKFDIKDVSDPNVLEELKNRNLVFDKYGNRKGPLFVFKKYPGIIYLGLPAGEEFPIFLEDIIHTSKEEFHISGDVAKKIAKINQPIDIFVFVTPTCPYCPYMTHSSHQFAMINKNIRSIMIEATEFPELSDKFKVYGVPHIEVLSQDGSVLGGFEGMVDTSIFASKLEKILENINKQK